LRQVSFEAALCNYPRRAKVSSVLSESLAETKDLAFVGNGTFGNISSVTPIDIAL
jgi:hypothetical protein